MCLKNNNKGQSALEYLLIVSGVIIVAVIVIVLVTDMGSSQRKVVEEQSSVVIATLDDSLQSPIVTNLGCGDTDVRFTITSKYEHFLYRNENDELISLPAPINNIYTINYDNLPLEAGYYLLQVAVVRNENHSALSAPAIRCSSN